MPIKSRARNCVCGEVSGENSWGNSWRLSQGISFQGCNLGGVSDSKPVLALRAVAQEGFTSSYSHLPTPPKFLYAGLLIGGGVVIFIFLSFWGRGAHPQHMEVPRLGVKLELQLLAYSTARVMQDLSCICDLHHRSQQCLILNPLSKAIDRTHIIMDTRQVS